MFTSLSLVTTLGVPTCVCASERIQNLTITYYRSINVYISPEISPKDLQILPYLLQLFTSFLEGKIFFLVNPYVIEIRVIFLQ